MTTLSTPSTTRPLSHYTATTAILSAALFRARDALTDDDTKLRLGFIYANYKPGAFMWEIVVIGRLVLFAFISVVYKRNVRLQAILGLAILFASVLAHEVVRPFASKELQEIEGEHV